MTPPERARLKVTLGADLYHSIVEIDGKLLPCREIRLEFTPPNTERASVVLRVPLEYVDVSFAPEREAIARALDELGVPDEEYPAPVANAVAILRGVK